MKPYAMAEAEMGVPEGWIDASITTLVYDHPEGPVKLLVLRSVARSESLADATRQQLADLRRQLPRFELVAEGACTIAGQEGVALTIRFAPSDGDVYQRMVSFLADGRLVALAVQGPPQQAKAVDALFDQAVGGALPRTPEERSWP